MINSGDGYQSNLKQRILQNLSGLRKYIPNVIFLILK